MGLDKMQSGVNGTVTVKFYDNVAVIIMDCGQNRCNKLMTKRMNKALDEVLANDKSEVLVTMGTGKYYSNGLDLEWISAMSAAEKGEELLQSLKDITALSARILTFPMPTIAALNGHTYAMGAINSLCNDYRIMKAERGWWCLNEVHIGMGMPANMRSVIRSKVPMPTYHDTIVIGKNYTAEAGMKAGIIHKVVSQDAFLDNVLQFAKEILPMSGYKREYIGNMKKAVYEETVDLLMNPNTEARGSYRSKI